MRPRRKYDQPFDKRFLHAPLKVKDRPKNEFFKKVTKARRSKSMTSRLAAAIVLSAYAQKTDVIFLSKMEASRILLGQTKRPNSYRQISGATWKKMRSNLLDQGFMVEVRAASNFGFGSRKAGLYRIIHPGFLEQLTGDISG